MSQKACLPWFLRFSLGLAGIGLAVLLTTAALLEPSPQGMGTHQQLGLPPCTFVKLLNIRCPSCGMTTAWSHMVRGQLFQSFGANSGGALLAVAAMLTAPWILICALLGRWLGGPPDERLIVVLVLSIVFVTLVDWAIRLAN